MKNRIRRFYQDNKTKIVVGGTAIALTVVFIHRHNANEEDPIKGVGFWTNQDGDQLIRVGLKNGRTHDYFRTTKV